MVVVVAGFVVVVVVVAGFGVVDAGSVTAAELDLQHFNIYL